MIDFKFVLSRSIGDAVDVVGFEVGAVDVDENVDVGSVGDIGAIV